MEAKKLFMCMRAIFRFVYQPVINVREYVCACAYVRFVVYHQHSEVG